MPPVPAALRSDLVLPIRLWPRAWGIARDGNPLFDHRSGAGDTDEVAVAGRAPGFSCSASRESLPIGAGRLDTGRSGFTTFTRRPVLEVRSEPGPAGAAAGDPLAAAAGTVTGPGSLVAEDGIPILTTTVAAIATTSIAKTPHTVRMHRFSHRTLGHAGRASGGRVKCLNSATPVGITDCPRGRSRRGERRARQSVLRARRRAP